MSSLGACDGLFSRRTVSMIGAALLIMLSPLAVLAQSDADTLADLRACARVERENARLACFDGVLAAEAPAGEPARAAVARPAAAPVATQTRGGDQSAARESAAEQRSARAEPEPSTPEEDSPRTVTIVEIRVGRPGTVRFVAGDGRVFVQTGSDSNRRPYPDVPFEAVLEDGALGSQFLAVEGRRRVRVTTAD